jgi:hypothetical protein
VSELFAGLYQKVEREVTERAKVLAASGHNGRLGAQTARRRAALAALAA